MRLFRQGHPDPEGLWREEAGYRQCAGRQGIKEFSSWPTIPQLYVAGEFIGGSDIMNEMNESGELKTLLDQSGATA